MKNARLILILSFILMAQARSTASPPASGTVQGPAPNAGISVAFPAGSEVQPRDVFIILHGGKPLGECIVISVKGTTAVLLPKANFTGQAAKGDEAVFVRHALAVGSLRESDRGPMPAWSHGFGKGADGWYTVSVAEGPFEVRMPGKPLSQVKSGFCMWVDEEKDARYSILYLDTKSTLDTKDPQVQAAVFADVAAIFQKEHGGQLNLSKVLPVQGYPGCEYELSNCKPPFPHLEARMFLSGHRLYQMWVESRPDSKADTKKFFTSMLLLDSVSAQRASGQAARGWHNYSDSTSGFSLSYPPEVSFTRDPAEIAQISQSQSTLVKCCLILGPNQHMSVLVGRAATPSSMELATGLLALAVKGGAESIQNPTESPVGGKSFVSLEYANAGNQIRTYVYVRPDTREAYLVNLTSDRGHFSQIVPLFDEILKSLSFNF